MLSDVLLAVWAFAYFAYPLSIGGRTPGMGLVGLEVVRADGHPLDNRHAVIRVLALLLSIVFFWLAVILVLVRRDRRTIHDLIGGTAVVYSWDARGARLRVLARRDHVEPADRLGRRSGAPVATSETWRAQRRTRPDAAGQVGSGGGRPGTGSVRSSPAPRPAC